MQARWARAEGSIGAVDLRWRPPSRRPDKAGSPSPAPWEPRFDADDWADAAERLATAQAWYQLVTANGCAEATVAAARTEVLRARERIDGRQRRALEDRRRADAA